MDRLIENRKEKKMLTGSHEHLTPTVLLYWLSPYMSESLSTNIAMAMD